MKSFLKLIRYKNLLIIIFTQYAIRWFVIYPILQYYNYDIKQVAPFCQCLNSVHLQLQFSEINFALLVLVTVLLAAAGYVINDYFDRKTDLVNHPDSVIVDKTINSRAAIIIHTVLNVVAILIGFYISYMVRHLSLGIIFILITGILWFYSTSYKRQLLVGNIIVAILTAMVPLMVLIYEVLQANHFYQGINCDCNLLIEYNLKKEYINMMYSVKMTVFAFAFFAFITTLIREITKDIEDLEGDQTYGRKSLPIVAGVKISKIVVGSLTAITILSLALIYVYTWKIELTFTHFFYILKNDISFWYFLIAIILPLLLFIYKIIKASDKNDFHFASNLIKIVMLLGLLYSLIIFYKLSFLV